MLYVHVYQYAAIVQHVFLHTAISTVHVAGTGLLSIKHVLKQTETVSYLPKKGDIPP
jgi:hypothetical protein